MGEGWGGLLQGWGELPQGWGVKLLKLLGVKVGMVLQGKWVVFISFLRSMSMKNIPDQLSQQQGQLVVDHISFAKRLATQFYHQRKSIPLEYQDFEAAAFLGLCDAARRFEEERGMNFTTYAYFRVRGSMYDFMRRGFGVSRRNYDSSSNPDSKETSRKRLPLPFAKNVSELAQLIHVIDAAGIRLHLNADKQTFEISYVDQETPEAEIILKRTKEYLHELIDQLPEVQRKIVKYRYFSNYTYDEIRKECDGISRSCVSRLHGKALDALRQKFFAGEKSSRRLIAQYEKKFSGSTVKGGI